VTAAVDTPIRALLVHQRLENMRQDRGGGDIQHQIAGRTAPGCAQAARQQPESQRHGEHDVLVRRIGEELKQPFDLRRGMSLGEIRNRAIEPFPEYLLFRQAMSAATGRLRSEGQRRGTRYEHTPYGIGTWFPNSGEKAPCCSQRPAFR
jgi:hypothetical protein